MGNSGAAYQKIAKETLEALWQYFCTPIGEHYIAFRAALAGVTGVSQPYQTNTTLVDASMKVLIRN